MSKYEGLVFEGFSPRTPLGAAAPAASLPDMSRWGNDGTMTDVTWVQLPSGLWVMSFNRISSFVDLGTDDSLIIIGPTTLESWINPMVLDVTSQRWMSRDGATEGCHRLRMRDNDGHIAWWRWTGVGNNYRKWETSTLALQEDIWAHVVVSFDGTDAIIYLNGVVEAPAGVNAAFANAPAHNTFIGRAQANYFGGYIVMPRIYNYALTPDQINSHFAAERTLFGV